MTVQQDNIKVSFTCQVKFSNDTDDEWCETTERSSGVMDTLLQELDIIQDGDRIIRFAPRNLITVKDLCLFTIVQCVNGNYEAKIEESTVCAKHILQIKKITDQTNSRKCKFIIT